MALIGGTDFEGGTRRQRGGWTGKRKKKRQKRMRKGGQNGEEAEKEALEKVSVMGTQKEMKISAIFIP